MDIKKMVNYRKDLTLIVEIVVAKLETENSRDKEDLQSTQDLVLDLQQMTRKKTQLNYKICAVIIWKSHLSQMKSLKCAKLCLTMIFE